MKALALKFGKLILGIVIDKIIGLIESIKKKRKRHQTVDRESNDSVKPLRDAKTPEEVDRATDSALDGF